jgi:N,N'-diacetyllegionaminate synthase
MNTQNITIIGEIGVNHNGDVEKALSLVDIAVDSKLDIVKFQTFLPENMITKYAKMAEYQKKDTVSENSQYDLLERYALTQQEFKIIYDYCISKNIKFLSSAFDLESLDFLLELGMNQIKIPSGEITNFPLLKKIAPLNFPTYLSTGMSNLNEIKDALNLLVEGGTDQKQICIMQCTSMYPTPSQDVNLNVLKTYKANFGDNIGFSDHTTGFAASLGAAALGARVIEKHFTLNKNMDGPDHQASLDPKQLKEFVTNLREIPIMMGAELKSLSPEEEANRNLVRKSIVAKVQIQKGDIFDENNITTKRPGNGMSPLRWEYILGKIASKTYEQDEMILE